MREYLKNNLDIKNYSISETEGLIAVEFLGTEYSQYYESKSESSVDSDLKEAKNSLINMIYADIIEILESSKGDIFYKLDRTDGQIYKYRVLVERGTLSHKMEPLL